MFLVLVALGCKLLGYLVSQELWRCGSRCAHKSWISWQTCIANLDLCVCLDLEWLGITAGMVQLAKWALLKAAESRNTALRRYKQAPWRKSRK